MRISHLLAIVRRLGLAATFGLLVCLAMFARDTARAQAPLPPATFAYTVYLPGWNLISPAGQTAIDVGSLTAVISGPLFTFQPNAANYATTDLGNVKPGFGYWANFTKTTAIALDKSSRDSYTVTVPAGQCVMVGNPSTKGSARVTGAERTYIFSTAANTYLEENLIGIGRGAWACNDARSSVVSVAFTIDVNGANWPDCCGPTPSDNRGQSFLVFKNDSPYPLIVGMRQMDQNGDYLDDGDLLRGLIDSCVTCPEYVPSRHALCSGDAVTQSIDLKPGAYTLHLQADGPNVPDLQASVSVEPNTTYTLCYFVDANRPQRSLP